MFFVIVGILGLAVFGPQCFEHIGPRFSFRNEMQDITWWFCVVVSVLCVGLCTYGIFK
jgi:hypothetical protein